MLMIKRDNFPLLLKRSHFINEISFSNTLYYQLLHSGTLPTVTIGDGSYILRDYFFRYTPAKCSSLSTEEINWKGTKPGVD